MCMCVCCELLMDYSKVFLPISMPTTSQCKAKCKIRTASVAEKRCNAEWCDDVPFQSHFPFFTVCGKKRAEARDDVWRDDALNHYIRLWKASMEIFERKRDESTLSNRHSHSQRQAYKKNVAGWSKSSQTLRKREVKEYLGHYCEFSCPHQIRMLQKSKEHDGIYA